MKPNLKKILIYLLSISVAIILLWFSARDVEWTEFVQELSECKWGYVIMSMAAGVVALWLRSLRWRRLLLPLDDSISRTTTFNGINIASITNFIFPYSGEFVRCGIVTRRSQPVDASDPHRKKASYEKVLGTIVLERGWEMLVMFLMLAIVVVGGANRYGDVFVRIWDALQGMMGGYAWLMIAGAFGLMAAGLYLIWRYRVVNTFCSKVWGILRSIGTGFSTCLRMDHKWLFFAYTLLIWVMYWFMAACTIWAVPFLSELNLIDALFISLVGAVGYILPLPGGIGGFHSLVTMSLLVVYGVEDGFTYAILSHTSQAIVQLLFGAGSYAYEAFKK